MAINRYVKTSQIELAGKEDLPPKARTHKIATSSLFEQTKHLRKDHHHRKHGVLGPNINRVTKTSATKSGSSFRGSARKLASHPCYMDFADAVRQYREAITTAKSEVLEPAFNELLARVDGLSLNGSAVSVEGVPSNHELDSIFESEAALAASLRDEKMTINSKRQNGTIEVREVQLGQTMLNLERVVKEKRGELERLLQELKSVDASITTTHDDVVRIEHKDVAKARSSYEANLRSLIDDADSIANSTRAAVKKARKEDEAQKREAEHKLEQFLR